MKKRIFPIFLAVMLLASSLIGMGLTAGAADACYAKAIEQDGIKLDGSVTDWEGVEKYPLSVYDKAANTWTASESDYVQVAVSADSIYLHFTVADDARSHEGIKRDHIRVSVITPEGKLGLMYTDEDAWTQVSSDLQGWWGVPTTFTENAIIAANSTCVYTYNEDGTVTVEARACLKDTTAAKDAPALKEGDEFKLAVQYVNDDNCTAQAFGGTAWYALGTQTLVADTAEEITATFKVGDKPAPVVQEEFTYEATATVGGVEMDIIEGVTTDLESDFWEWEDEADGLWEAAPKYALDVYDAEKGVYVKSEDEYVQFKYAYGQVYFRIHAKDADGKSADGLIRDGAFIGVVFPDGGVGRFFLGTDANDAVVWKEWGVQGWFDSAVGDQATELNAFTNNNTTACFYYKDGYVDFEGRATVKDAYRDYFVSGTELKVAVSYRDNQSVNGTTYEGGNWVKWGSTDVTCMNADAITGKVTLYDPSFRDTTGMEVVEATAGAENDGYGFDADGNLIVNVKATEGAASYRVNVFDRWDAATFIGNTWEPSETTKLTVGGLVADTDMTYQVVALDEAGEVIAVYPAVDFVVGKDPEVEAPDNEDNKPSDEDNKPSDEDVGKEEDTSSPETGVALPIGAMLFAAAASGAAVLTSKKRR